MRTHGVMVVALAVALGCSSRGGEEADAATVGDAARPVDAGRDVREASARDGANEAAGPRDAAGADSGPRGDDAMTIADASAPDAPELDAPDAMATCADGAPVAYTRASCPGTPAAVPAALASAAASASTGDVLSLDGLDDSSLPCFPVRVCVAEGAPTLLFSDEPESPSSDGVLYADELTAGPYRAYVYHVNAGTSPRTFPVVLLNEGTTTAHATLTAVGIAGPSTDYIDVGKQAAVRWYASAGVSTVVDIPAGARVSLDTDLDGTAAATNELVHAILDFNVDAPVKLSVVSILATEDAATVTAGLSLLPNTGQHVRGTFPGAALEIEPLMAIDGAGARHLRLGAGVTDATLTGDDYADGTSVTLSGNYGVAYTLRFAFTTGSAVLLSPQGGDWGGAGFLTTGGVAATPGVFPASQDSLGTQTDAIVVSTLASGTSGMLALLSAGGSNLPVDVVTVPMP